MPIDRNAFIDNYCDELEENIQKIDSSIITLKKDPENSDILKSLMRMLHTVKGSSRMLAFYKIEEIAHGLENVFKGVTDGRYKLTSEIIDLVFVSTAYFKHGASLIRQKKNDDIQTDRLLAIFQLAESNEPFSTESARLLITENQDESEDISLTAGTGTFGESDTIRVKFSKIDNIIRLLNGLIIRQFQFKKENELIEEIENSLRRLQALKRRGDSGERFDDQSALCMKQISALRKNFLEQLPLLERNLFDVQDEILSIRMLPLHLIMTPLEKMAAEMSIHLKKEINLTISGAGILIDKAILEHISDPLLHIVRNSIDHGIETSEERVKLKKPPAGSISIKSAAEGGNIVVRVIDDGSGVDYDSIRMKALEKYPERTDEILSMTRENLSAFLFQSGFTTKDKTSEISGRGVGLDIVRTEIEGIKGRVSLNSEKGKGTEFILSLPLSLSTIEGFFIESGGKKFLFPSNFVTEIITFSEDEVVDLISKRAVKWRGGMIPLYSLAAVLNVGSTVFKEKNFAVIVESLGDNTAVLVDSVLRYSTLVHKPLPSNLSRLKSLQGIVFDENFNIVSILHIPELMQRFRRIKNIDERKKYSSDEKEYKRILIVDDSLPTREIEKSILELENYTVETAVDGIDALEKTEEQYYHLIITDIQMPRMDGLTLADNLRKREKYSETPIIVVSSAEDNSFRDKFRRLNINSFVRKSEFDRGILLEEVKSLIG